MSVPATIILLTLMRWLYYGIGEAINVENMEVDRRIDTGKKFQKKEARMTKDLLKKAVL